jgi:ABC-type bacteriocin/lantibiotic exporter with double-glycine peptidase domain
MATLQRTVRGDHPEGGTGGAPPAGLAAETPAEDPAEEEERFAATLQRLKASRRRRVPFVKQLENADCGAACLAMVLAYHDRIVPLDQVRRVAGTDRGANAATLIAAGEYVGLRGRGLRVDVEDLPYLPPAAILHWDFKHFVVFERSRRADVDIVDPAFGRRRVPIGQFRKHFTGVALVYEPVEELAPSAPARSKIWRYLARLFSERGLVRRVLLTSIVMRALALALPLLTAMVVDRVVPRGDYNLLLVAGCGMGFVLGLQLLSSIIRSYLLIELRTRLDVRMTLGFVAHLFTLPYAYFIRRSAGDLMLRVGSNTQIRDLLTSSMLSSLLDGGLAITYLVLLLTISPLMGGLSVVLAALQVTVLLLSRHRYALLASQDLESQARAHSYLVQMLVGIETLKVSGAENRALEQWTNLYVDQLNVALRRSRMTMMVDAVNGFLNTAGPLLLLGCGTLLVLDQEISLGTMLAVAALATGFLTPLANLVGSAFQLQQIGSYVERIDDVLSAEPEQRRGVVAPARLTGAVELHQVSFRYSANEPYVVRDVSLSIEAGTTVAIVGSSGSGKSTLAALLLGLHQPSEGRITYDGYNLAELDHRKLRQQLGMVPQNPFLFGTSIQENLQLGNPTAPLDRIVTAARQACIDADIRAMPMSYETIVADGGASLSGGQRQRLALARALLHEPAILVLDEATSSLDATTERKVMDNLRDLTTTRIVIAHRLSTVVDADQIIVMQSGRVVEIGSHGELCAADGVYAALVANQQIHGDSP